MGTVRPHLQSKRPGVFTSAVGAWMLRKLPTNPAWVACASSFCHHLHIHSLIHQPQPPFSKSLKHTSHPAKLVFQGDASPISIFLIARLLMFSPGLQHMWKGYFASYDMVSSRLPPFTTPPPPHPRPATPPPQPPPLTPTRPQHHSLHLHC